jgi:hypothetical protein
MVDLLLEIKAGANLANMDPWGLSLYAAIQQGRQRVVQALLDGGASLSGPNQRPGVRAHRLAAQGGHRKIAAAVLAKVRDI